MAKKKYKINDEVEHIRYGYGTVVAINFSARGEILKIDFEDDERRSLLISDANLYNITALESDEETGITTTDNIEIKPPKNRKPQKKKNKISSPVSKGETAIISSNKNIKTAFSKELDIVRKELEEDIDLEEDTDSETDIYNTAPTENIAADNIAADNVATDIEKIDYDKIALILRKILREHNAPKPPLKPSWEKGELILKPSKAGTGEVIIPIKEFYGKILSIYQELNLLEQQIQFMNNLTNEEKIHLSFYVSRIHSTLEIFDRLFIGETHKK